MSVFVTRPEIPVPGIREMSTPFSSAIARTTGDDRRFSSSSWDSPGWGATEEEGIEDCLEGAGADVAAPAAGAATVVAEGFWAGAGAAVATGAGGTAAVAGCPSFEE